ncbi:hypothetical protein DRN63_03000 [Nanoarchaeota archaeon]|nr:MAG: hypothetical protein DRN63_03000 [Nanoarchaeota archaeon]
MLRVCLVGPGDTLEYHYFELLGLSKDKFEKEIDNIARILAEQNYEIVLVPDRGVSFEVAKKYKKYGGKKVVGLVPLSDKDFGVDHLKPYMEAKMGGKRIFDEFIDTGNWYKQDLIHCILGDVVLVLGYSLGSLGELVYGLYLYKVFVGNKPEVKIPREKIHPQVRAGKTVPYSVIVYEPFVKGHLNYEIEGYIKKLGARVYYVKNLEELEEILREFKTLVRD